MPPGKSARTEYQYEDGRINDYIKSILLGFADNKLVKTYSLEKLNEKGLNYTFLRLAGERDQKSWVDLKNNTAYFTVTEKDGKPVIKGLETDIEAARKQESQKKLLAAVENGDVAEATTVLDQGTPEDNKQMVNQQNKKGETLLQMAIEKGDADVVSVLLQHGAQFNPDAAYVKKAVREATREKQVEMSKVLFDACLDAKGNKGVKPYAGFFLWSAVSSGDKQYLEKILNAGVDVNTAVMSGYNIASEGTTAPLIEAAGDGYKDIVQVLLDRNTDPNAKGHKDKTALIEAASGGHAGIVQMLLNKKANPNMQDDNGDTALIGAAKHGHAEVVRVLLRAKPDLNLKDKPGQTALVRAAKSGYKGIVKQLLDAGAEIGIADFVAKEHPEIQKKIKETKQQREEEADRRRQEEDEKQMVEAAKKAMSEELERQRAEMEKKALPAPAAAPPLEQEPSAEEETSAQRSREEEVMMKKLLESVERTKVWQQRIEDSIESDKPKEFESKAALVKAYFVEQVVDAQGKKADLTKLFPSAEAEEVIHHLQDGKYTPGYFLKVTGKGGILHSRPALIYFLKHLAENALKCRNSEINKIPSNTKMMREISEELNQAFKQTTKASRLNPVFTTFTKGMINIFDKVNRASCG